MRRPLFAAMGILALGLLPRVTMADVAGIPSNQMDFFAARQVRDEYCWAASIQMVMNYYGVNVNQVDVVRRTYGADANGNPPDAPANNVTISQNLNGWGIDSSGQRYTVSSTFVQGAPPTAYVVNEMKAHRPIIVSYMPSPGGGHAVVVTGVDYTDTPYGPIINSIMVRDPWPNAQNAANKGRVQYSAGQFARLMTGAWFIRVQKSN